MAVCKKVLYRGQVQGVGFRYTTANLARGYPVAGYVRNLPDGRVELVVEGNDPDVARFLQDLARKMAECIEEQTTEDLPPQGFGDFAIRR